MNLPPPPPPRRPYGVDPRLLAADLDRAERAIVHVDVAYKDALGARDQQAHADLVLRHHVAAAFAAGAAKTALAARLGLSRSRLYKMVEGIEVGDVDLDAADATDAAADAYAAALDAREEAEAELDTFYNAVINAVLMQGASQADVARCTGLTTGRVAQIVGQYRADLAAREALTQED